MQHPAASALDADEHGCGDAHAFLDGESIATAFASAEHAFRIAAVQHIANPDAFLPQRFPGSPGALPPPGRCLLWLSFGRLAQPCLYPSYSSPGSSLLVLGSAAVGAYFGQGCEAAS